MKEKYLLSLSNFLEKTRQTVKALERTLAKDEWDEAQCAGAGKFLSNLYMSIENILQTILRANNVKVPKDEAWHKTLLNNAKEVGLYPDLLSNALYNMLQFRHLERMGYGIDMDENEIRANAPEAITTYHTFEGHILALYPELTRLQKDA